MSWNRVGLCQLILNQSSEIFLVKKYFFGVTSAFFYYFIPSFLHLISFVHSLDRIVHNVVLMPSWCRFVPEKDRITIHIPKQNLHYMQMYKTYRTLKHMKICFLLGRHEFWTDGNVDKLPRFEWLKIIVFLFPHLPLNWHF